MALGDSPAHALTHAEALLCQILLWVPLEKQEHPCSTWDGKHSTLMQVSHGDHGALIATDDLYDM